MVYLLKVAIAMGLCIVLYHGLLADRKTFVFNRFYLLSTMVLSFFAPLMHFPIIEKASEISLSSADLTAISARNYRLTQEVLVNPVVEVISIYEVLYATVILISACLLFRFFKNFGLQLYRSWSSNAEVIEGLRVINSNTLSPYSFFNALFVPADMEKSDVPDEILQHELSHWKHLHSLDLLLIELLLVIQWFNPILYLYRKAIRDNHEYTADHDVTLQFDDTKAYIQVLLQYALPKNVNSQLILSFNHSSTKKRIQMINANTQPSSPLFFAVVFFVTLIALGACGDLTRIETELQFRGLDKIYNTPIKSSMHPQIIKEKAELLGVDLENIRGQKKLSPRLVKKFSKDNNYYITYDGVKIDNDQLHIYAGISRFVQVREIFENDPLFVNHKFRVSILSPESFDLLIASNRKWSVGWAKEFNVIYGNGDVATLYDALKNHTSWDFKVDTTRLPEGVSVKESFLPPQPPLSPPIPAVKRPTQKYLNDLADPKKYGVWIDGVRVSNSSLAERSPDEFSYYSQSLLARNAVNFDKHTYQVNLMTNDAFQKWIKESKLFRKEG